MANYNVGTTGIVVTANVESAINGLNKLKATVTSVKTAMGSLDSSISKAGSKTQATSKEVKSLDKSFNELPKSIDKTDKSLNKVIKSGIKFATVMYALRQVKNFVIQATAQVASFGENVNLYNVAMRHNTEEAMRFQYKLSQMYGINMSNSMKYQGQFMNLAQALGIGTEMAYEMSEALTLLTFDLASLYNWTDDMAYNRLLAGIVGQTKPLRYAGIDVTQQTIQPILGELGIDKSVIQLTQQEKVMLRMIAVLRQSGNAHNDYGRTIESAANQMKVWEHQITELMRWLGALWYQITLKILPMMNGFVMAIKEVTKAIAMMLGFDMKDFDFVTGNMGDNFVDLEEGIEGADNALKKMNGSLRKFDEVNNIAMPQSGSGVGVGLGSALTLQKALTTEMEKYREKLSEVSMKAHGIRDTIMDWLGFTKVVNTETEEVSFTIETINTNLGIIIGTLSTFAGLLIFKALVKPLIDLTLLALGLGEAAVISIGKIGGIATTTATGISATFGLLIIGVGLLIAAGIDLWNDTTERAIMFKDTLSELLREIGISFNNFYDNAIKPIVDVVIQSLRSIWDEGLKPLWEDFKIFAAPIIEIFAMITFVILRVSGYMLTNLVPAFQLAFDFITTLFNSVAIIFGGILRMIGGIFDVLVGMFTGNGDKIAQGFSNIFGGIAKIVYGVFYGLINGIIDIFNFVIRFINKIPGVNVPLLVKVNYNGNAVQVPKINAPSFSNNNTGGSSNNSQVSMYANGGFPSQGEMFVMNEKEPEWLGNLGGRTAVMNQDQVVKSVLSLVDKSTNAMSNSRQEQSQVVNLYADDILLGKAVIKSINKTSLATGLTIK